MPEYSGLEEAKDLRVSWKRNLVSDWDLKTMILVVVGAISTLINIDGPWSKLILNSGLLLFVTYPALIQLSCLRHSAWVVTQLEARMKHFRETADAAARACKELGRQVEFQSSAWWAVSLK